MRIQKYPDTCGRGLSPLYLSHETKRDVKVTTEECGEQNKDGSLRFRAAKCALKVQAYGYVADTFEVELSLITRKL